MKEDIFSSIKRLVLENDASMSRPAAEAPGESDITIEVIAANDLSRPVRSQIIELSQPVAEEPRSKEPNMPSAVTELPQKPAGEPIMSATAAAAAHNAFAALSQLQIRSSAGEDNTLQGLVGDLLRPMLREWLDRELKGMVEARVDAEVRRIAGHL